MKKDLKHKPNTYFIQKLLAKYRYGRPLDADELNFLSRHERTLSHRDIDPALKYYLKHYHHDYHEDYTFLLRHEAINLVNLAKLKKRLALLLASKKSSVVLKFSEHQFETFKKVAYQELILTHGNQLLSGAPFHAGGIPQTLFFQWGNLFGVAKYVVLPDEKAQKSNFLIYFEDRQDRELNQCIEEYIKEHQAQPAPSPAQPTPQQHYHTPRLDLKIHKGDEKEDKK